MRTSSRRTFFIGMVVACAATAAWAGALLEPYPAPEWKTSQWLEGNPGKLANHRGKVVVLHFFQLWCPTSDTFSIPLFQKWNETFGADEKILIVGIHSVFEAHDQQTPAQLAAYAASKGIRYPVGIDAYDGDESVPITMDRFEAGGTPHLVIIDKTGNVVFSHFGPFDPRPVEAYIDRLILAKLDPTAESRPSRSRPGRGAQRGGRSRPDTSRRTPSNPTPPPKPKPTPPDGIDLEASGTYKVSFEQTGKSCGDPIPPMDVLAEITLHADRLEVRSTRPYLGLRTLEASYDPATGRFEAKAQDRSREKGVEIQLSVELTGTVTRDASPPTVEYEFILDKEGAEPDWGCTIEGRGSGSLSIPRRK